MHAETDIFHSPGDTSTMYAETDPPPPPPDISPGVDKAKTCISLQGKKANKIIIGETMICKEFLSGEEGVPTLYLGTVVDRRRLGQHYLYMIEYSDGDTEEMFNYEVRNHMIVWFD